MVKFYMKNIEEDISMDCTADIREKYQRKFSDLFDRMIGDLEAQGDSSLGLHFSGSTYTGDPSVSDILILSINPGFGGEWPNRSRVKPTNNKMTNNKFIGEYEDGSELATKIVDWAYDGDFSLMDKTVESYSYSIFATPDIKELESTLNSVEKDTNRLHHEVMKDHLCWIVNIVKPKLIICIGVENTDSTIKKLNSIDGYQVDGETCWEKLPNSRGFLHATLANGTKLLGCYHLSRKKGEFSEQWFKERFNRVMKPLFGC